MVGSGTRRSVVAVLGLMLVVLGGGLAAARTSSGPPWAQEPVECDAAVDPTCVAEEEEIDVTQVRAEVEQFFGEFDGDCGADLLGEADLADGATLEALDAFMTSFESGQTSHGVQGTRSVMENCEDHANDGLRNALYHHGLNWIKHHEHELRMQEKFEAKWPDGKPGGGNDGTHGNPHTEEEDVESTDVESDDDGGVNGHGNGHTETHGGGSSNGNAYGHSK